MKTAVTPVRILKACSVPACRLLMVNRVCLITVARLERAVRAWCSWRAALHVCCRLPILIKTGQPPSGPFPLGAQLCLMPLLLFSDRSSIVLFFGVLSRWDLSRAVMLKVQLAPKVAFVAALCGYPLSVHLITAESTEVDCYDLSEHSWEWDASGNSPVEKKTAYADLFWSMAAGLSWFKRVLSLSWAGLN